MAEVYFYVTFANIKKNVPRHILALPRGCFSSQTTYSAACAYQDRRSFLNFRRELSRIGVTRSFLKFKKALYSHKELSGFYFSFHLSWPAVVPEPMETSTYSNTNPPYASIAVENDHNRHPRYWFIYIICDWLRFVNI